MPDKVVGIRNTRRTSYPGSLLRGAYFLDLGTEEINKEANKLRKEFNLVSRSMKKNKTRWHGEIWGVNFRLGD